MGSWRVLATKTFTKILKNLEKSDRKRFEKINQKLKKFKNDLLTALEEGKPVSKHYQLHQLQNFRYKGTLYPDAYDAHLGGDTVLIFLIDRKSKEVIFLFIGSHSELFG